MVANGVSIYPGAYFLCPEPGWFRIIFAMDTEVLQLGELQLCSNRGAKEGGAAGGEGRGDGIKGFTVISLSTKSPPRSRFATNE